MDAMTDEAELLPSAKAAMVTIGEGRGFLVGARMGRIVVTAAHCLPHLPSAHPASYTEERTYPGLLGPLGGEPTVWAECLFVDPNRGSSGPLRTEQPDVVRGIGRLYGPR